MKFFFFLSAILFSQKVISQNAFQYQNSYTGYAVNGNDIVLPTYGSSNEIEGKPYFSKEWVKGSVKTTDNQEFSKRLLFMYDKVGGNLYFKNQDSATIMEADKSKIYSFNLTTDKPHVFMKGDFISIDYIGKFFEVLIFDNKKYSFLKYTTTTFQETQVSKAAQALTETISHGRYVDKTTYFIYSNGILTPVELKKKNFAGKFGPDATKVDAYIKNNNDNFNESYIIDMLSDINEQIQ